MQNKTISKVIVTLLIVSTVFVVTFSSIGCIVFGQTSTLDDVLVELEDLKNKLDALDENVTATNVTLESLNEVITKIESTLDYFREVSVTVAELGTIIFALEDLTDLTTELHSNLVSGNETVTTESVTEIKTTVQEIRTTVQEIKITLNDLQTSYISSVPEDLKEQVEDMHFLIQILTVLVIVAVALALIAAITSLRLVKRVKQIN